MDLEAKVAPPAYRSFSHVSGRVSSGRLRYEDIYAFAWWRGGDPEAPVRLELSEELGGLFTETRVQADYLPSVARAFGADLTLSAEGRPEETLYHAQVRRLETRELVSIGGETMLTKLQDLEPETLRVKGPFTPKTALETMLKAWQGEAPWLEWERVPELFTYAPNGVSVPSIGALLLEQPTDLSTTKTSAYGWLTRFFSLFADYIFRVNQAGRLEVKGPSLEGDVVLGTSDAPFELLSTLYHFEPEDDSDAARNQAQEESNTPRARHTFGWGARQVRLFADVYEPDGRYVIEYTDVTLAAGEENRYTTPEGYSIVFALSEETFHVELIDTDIGVTYCIRGHVEIVESAEAEPKRLTPRDVGFDLRETTDIDGVVNRCSVTSQGFEFVFEQELLEPSYVLFRDDDSVLDGTYTEPDEEERKKITSVWSAPESTIIGSDTLRAAINIEAYSRDGNVKNFGLEKVLDVNVPVRVFVERQTGAVNTSLELGFSLRFTGSEVHIYGASWTGSSGFNDFEPTAYIVKLNAAGEKFAPRKDGKVFQQADESGGSPFGIKHERIDAGPFPLSNEVASAIAQRRVTEAKEPKTVAEFEQSPRLPVLPDDLGSVIELPDGRRGIVTSFSYAEAHTPQGSLSKSSVKVRLEGHKSEI